MTAPVSTSSPAVTTAPRGDVSVPPSPNAPVTNSAAITAEVKRGEAGAALLNGTPTTTAPAQPATPGSSTPTTGNQGDFAVPPPTPPPGLKVGPEGWPAGTVETPGGFRIVPEGNTNWSIYSPNQSPSETPTTRVWGDPHVTEGDGTRWDFTKDSNFVLPDGTTIRCDTTSETGQSVSQGLTIVAGNDKVDVTGVNTGSPQVTKDPAGASKWINENLPALQSSNTFSMQTKDGGEVSWFRSTNGQMEGKVVGATHNVDGKNSYDQILENKGMNGETTGGAVNQVGQGGKVSFDDALAAFGIKSNGGNGMFNTDQARAFFNDIQRVFDMLRNNEAMQRQLMGQRRA
jgi:hypothetical protein